LNFFGRIDVFFFCRLPFCANLPRFFSKNTKNLFLSFAKYDIIALVKIVLLIRKGAIPR